MEISKICSIGNSTLLDPKTTKKKYPEARVIVLDDNFNTFEHVANCLQAIIPGMSKDRSLSLIHI